MKITGFLIVVLAVIVGVVPYFFNCQYDGKTLMVTHVPQMVPYSARTIEMAGGIIVREREQERNAAV